MSVMGFGYGIRKHSTGTSGRTLPNKSLCCDLFCLLRGGGGGAGEGCGCPCPVLWLMFGETVSVVFS